TTAVEVELAAGPAEDEAAVLAPRLKPAGGFDHRVEVVMVADAAAEAHDEFRPFGTQSVLPPERLRGGAGVRLRLGGDVSHGEAAVEVAADATGMPQPPFDILGRRAEDAGRRAARGPSLALHRSEQQPGEPPYGSRRVIDDDVGPEVAHVEEHRNAVSPAVSRRRDGQLQSRQRTQDDVR